MGCVIAKGRKTVKPPVGCEGYLTRREAAIHLGLPSEFKIRQFEREGRLHAVRGRMGTAFYPEAEVLSLRAELGATPRPVPGRWSDADLIALLQEPTASGRLHTAVDLVTVAKINIARAERVYRFWCRRDETLAARVAGAARLLPHGATGAGRPETDVLPAGVPAQTEIPSGKSSASERRSAARLAHDGLVRSLRDPDPRVRAQAFSKLRDGARP